MSILAPFFLLGLAAIALPIWLHRLQTQTPTRQMFSSSMLLEQAEQRVHVQKKLRYLLLLALRILLLALLVFAFAKPVWERPPQIVAGPQAQLHLIVIDRSLSMGEGERIARARDKATALIDAMSTADRAEVVLADDGMEVLAGPLSGAPEGKTALRQAIAGVQAGAAQLNLGAMVGGLEGLVTNETQPVMAHLIGDFQDTGLPAQFGDLVPRTVNGRSIAVELDPVTDRDAENWGIETLKRTAKGVEVSVRSYHTAAREISVALSVNDVEKAKLSKPVPADGEAVFAFDNLGLNTGENRVTASLASNDSLTGDDQYHAVIDNVAAQTVPLLTADPKALPSKYLASAFAAAGGRYRAEPMDLKKFDARTLSRYPWILLEDLGSADAALAKSLRDYLNAGGAIMTALGERSLSLKQLPITEQRVLSSKSTPDSGDPLSIGSINNHHPVLTRTEGWRGINITRLLEVEKTGEDQSLISLDDGAPLLLEHKLGKGKVLMFTSSLDNTWNDLPVQPVFVSFVAEAAEYLSGSELVNRQQRVGATLSLADSGAIGQVIDPQGKKLLALADTQKVQSVKLSQPGFYQVYTQTGELLVAANPDPRESDLAVMSGEALQRWRDALIAQPAAASASAATTSKTPPFELWHALLALLAVIVLAESLLGNRYVFRRVDTPS